MRLFDFPYLTLGRPLSILVLVWLIGISDLQGQGNDPGLKLPPGFESELLYTVPNAQGSWVSMTTDPQGRLIASDQYGSLYRISTEAGVNVEKLNVKLGFAQGLLCAFDSLYVVAHPSTFEQTTGRRRNRGKIARAAGLYRLRDTNNDDQYDQIQLLREFKGQGEHGPHAVILSPDKKSLYICAGNHTKIPLPETSRVPRVWQEDQIIPRLPDAGGHGVGIKAPGGWVCKTDPDGKAFELVSVGFRNQYDIAFSPQGELFTYDADMEWDIGLPWYRPTRVCHVTSGSEFGWRNGSGKWPTYYPDSLPPTLDIGPGSPTGITFGTGAQFPAKYQDCLFIADWSYGLIYAVHLEPQGSSFTGTKEVFCTAPVLPVTDIVINPEDGAMYFLVGGRRSQSALYRVTYRGDESVAVTKPENVAEGVTLRRQLEALHHRPSADNVPQAWPFLAHPDRFIRFAARTVLELNQEQHWFERALVEKDIQARLESLLALVRTSDSDEWQGKVVASLQELKFESLTEEQQLHVLRLYGLVLVRMGPTSERTRMAIQSLSQYYPADTDLLDRELSRLLVAVQAKDVVEKTLPLLLQSNVQKQQVHFANVLLSAQPGWTAARRMSYLQWFTESARYAGGSSFRKYLTNIRTKFVGDLAPSERQPLESLIAIPIEPVDPYANLQARPVVKKWTMAELKDLSLEGGDAVNGKKMFALTQCYKCHIVQGEGGIVGPDLTGSSRRFNTYDLLQSIIDPDREVSDQYQATIFQLDDGRLVSGRIANLSGGRYMVQEDMIKPGQLTTIQVDQIDAMKPSRTSMMPAGLLDTLTRDEIRDLMVYLNSASGRQ